MPALKSIGFEKCYDTKSYKVKERTSMGITDGCFLSQVYSYIEKQPTPFYTFLVTLTSHAPFDQMPKSYINRILLETSIDKTPLGGYIQLIHYTDTQLGIFLDR
jgi:phosphoglycerol transferase MdoB-like AlkP superfamily enzyme